MTRKRAPHGPDRAEIIKRLNRIAGQVGGVGRMLEEDRYCIDILTQVQAIKAALSRAEDMILLDHTEHCIAEAIASNDPAVHHEKLTELVELYGKYKR